MALKNTLKDDTIYVGSIQEITVPCGESPVPAGFQTWDVFVAFVETLDAPTSLIPDLTAGRLSLGVDGSVTFTLTADETKLLVDSSDNVLSSVIMGVWRYGTATPMGRYKFKVDQNPIPA